MSRWINQPAVGWILSTRMLKVLPTPSGFTPNHKDFAKS